MIPKLRTAFNAHFSTEKHQALLDDIIETYNYAPKFKIAETPVFVPKELKKQLIEACEEILAVIDRSDFKNLTKDAFFDVKTMVPNESDRPKFIQLDFGVCKDNEGNLTPRLIELQGFPSLYFFQEVLGRMYRKYYGKTIPTSFTQHLNGMSSDEHIEFLRSEIVGDTDPKQVVLLEIEPYKQATAIDFYATEVFLGIKTICITDLKRKGRQLSYIDDDGTEIKILKIYNRIIFDELHARNDLQVEFNFQDEVDVEWIGHPNWFFRISKYTMPLLNSKYVPKSYLLNKLDRIPKDLENFVLKPLFSFAGAGVILHVTPEIIANITNKSNYLLQEKVKYAPVIETMDDPAKCEIRMMLLHNSKTDKMEIVSNLIRISKGEMIGVKFNKDKTWVGGSTGFFEPS